MQTMALRDETIRKVRPIQDNVWLELLEEKEPTTKGGIILPQTRDREPTDLVRALVIATGPGYRLRNGTGPLVPNQVKPGDVVLIGRLAGEDYAFDVSKPRQNRAAEFKNYRMVRHDEIAALVES